MDLFNKNLIRPVLIIPLLVLLVIGCGGGNDDNFGPKGDIADLLTPYKNVDEMSSGIGIFTGSHSGLDFTPIADNKSFQAASSGRVDQVEKAQNTISGNYQVNILIRYNSTYRLNYCFEPMTADSADGDTQLQRIRIKKGDILTKGDIIGELYVKNPSSHVDFGIIKDSNRVCPYPYFSEEAKNNIEQLAGRKMCNCPEHQ